MTEGLSNSLAMVSLWAKIAKMLAGVFITASMASANSLPDCWLNCISYIDK